MMLSTEHDLQQNMLYDKLHVSLHGHKQRIEISEAIPRKTLNDVIGSITYVFPDLFFVSDFTVYTFTSKVVIIPHYLYSDVVISNISEQCCEQAKKIISHISATNDYDTALQCHDLLSRNIKYVCSDNQRFHSIVGPLIDRKSVCEGYAKLYKFILDQLAIPCIIVRGTACNPVTNEEEAHAWNMVRVYDKWLHVDVTFDTTIRELNVLRYDYFGLSNEHILLDHQYDCKLYPLAADASLSFYEANNLSMQTKTALKDFLLRGLREGERDFVVKLPYTASEAELVKKVSNTIVDMQHTTNLFFSFSLFYNISQRVFHVHIDEMI